MSRIKTNGESDEDYEGIYGHLLEEYGKSLEDHFLKFEK